MRNAIRRLNDLTVAAVLFLFYFAAFAIPALVLRIAAFREKSTPQDSYWKVPAEDLDWRSDY